MSNETQEEAKNAVPNSAADLKAAVQELGQAFKAAEEASKTAVAGSTEAKELAAKQETAIAALDEKVENISRELSKAHEAATRPASARDEELREVYEEVAGRMAGEPEEAGEARCYPGGLPTFEEFAMEDRLFPVMLACPASKIPELCKRLEERHGKDCPEVAYIKRERANIVAGTTDGTEGSLLPPAWERKIHQTARLIEPVLAEITSKPINIKQTFYRLTTGNAVRYAPDDSSLRGQQSGATVQDFIAKKLDVVAQYVYFSVGEELIEDFGGGLMHGHHGNHCP